MLLASALKKGEKCLELISTHNAFRVSPTHEKRFSLQLKKGEAVKIAAIYIFSFSFLTQSFFFSFLFLTQSVIITSSNGRSSRD